MTSAAASLLRVGDAVCWTGVPETEGHVTHRYARGVRVLWVDGCVEQFGLDSLPIKFVERSPRRVSVSNVKVFS